MVEYLLENVFAIKASLGVNIVGVLLQWGKFQCNVMVTHVDE